MFKSSWLLCASVLFAILPARAVTLPDLYEVSMPVTSSRDAAFGEALNVVAVRVSGQRDAVERLGGALRNPRQYVQRFGSTADNILQVGFDSASVDRLLIDAGLPIWGRERPSTLLLLSVQGADGISWLDASSAAREREILSTVATQRGLPLMWPQANSQDGLQPGISDGSGPAALLQVAARYGANAVLLGRARGDGMGGYSVQWTLVSEDGGTETRGSLEDGIHFAADTFASIYAASGSSLDSVALDVSGIGNLNAYATTLNYLENMTVVRSVAVEQVAGDTIHFRLAVRGDATQLKRALALDNKLVPSMSSTSSDLAAQRLQFRYQP